MVQGRSRKYGQDVRGRPREFERLTRTVQGPRGDVRERVGPFVYGFSYKNGILNITVEKKEEWKHKAPEGTSIAIE